MEKQLCSLLLLCVVDTEEKAAGARGGYSLLKSYL